MNMNMNHKKNCNIIQVVLGLIFLVSGVLKTVDAYGTILKLDEYAHHLNFPLLETLDKHITAILCALEMGLGVWMLTFIYRRISTTIVVGLTSCFTLLNLYFVLHPELTIADCGCFGEMFPMNMTESLIKNIIILTLAGYLLWHQRHNKHYIWDLPNAIIGIAFSLSSLFAVIAVEGTSSYNPTGYNEGTDLRKKKDFVILDENFEDVTAKLLNSSEEIYIYVQKNNDPLWQSSIRRYCRENNHTYFTLSNKEYPEKEYNAPYYYVDENLLKSFLRCKDNGVVYIRNGVIEDSWPEDYSWWILDID